MLINTSPPPNSQSHAAHDHTGQMEMDDPSTKEQGHSPLWMGTVPSLEVFSRRLSNNIGLARKFIWVFLYLNRNTQTFLANLIFAE